MFGRKATTEGNFGPAQNSFRTVNSEIVVESRADFGEVEVDNTQINFGKALSQNDFVRLYDSYFPRLYSYVSYRTNSREDAEDLVAQVFEKVLTKFSTFDPRRGNLDTWIFSIARNALANRFRDRSRHPQQLLTENLEQDSEDSPAHFLLKQEELQRLRQYLGRLNERERELLALRYGANLAHKRIGELLNMTEGNVTVSLGRVVRKLRRYFEADEQS